MKASSDPALGVVGKQGQRRQLYSPCLSPIQFWRFVCDPTQLWGNFDWIAGGDRRERGEVPLPWIQEGFDCAARTRRTGGAVLLFFLLLMFLV